MHFDIIETERLYLQKVTAAQYTDLLLHGSDEILEKQLGIPAQEHEKYRDRARKGLTTHNRSLLLFQLIDKKSSSFVGSCGYHTWYTDHARAEIGYSLDGEKVKRQGIMTEALGPVLDYGFREMQLNRIEAFIGPENIPSLKLVRKFGFTEEGLLRSHYCKNGIFEDSVVFSLLRDQYFSGNR